MTEPEHEPVKAPEGEEEEKKEEQPEEKKEETPEASPSPIDEAKETLTKLEEQIKNQLGIEIEFEFPADISPGLVADNKKDRSPTNEDVKATKE